jgi:hypothetical protein
VVTANNYALSALLELAGQPRRAPQTSRCIDCVNSIGTQKTTTNALTSANDRISCPLLCVVQYRHPIDSLSSAQQ